jgi:hypothetical protein
VFERLPAGRLLHDLLMAVFGYRFLDGIHPSFWTVPTDR